MRQHLLALVIALAGCTQSGNDLDGGMADDGFLENGATLVGRHYYQLTSGATCQENTLPPEPIPAWTGVQFVRDATGAIVYDLTGACEEYLVDHPYDPSVFQFSEDLKTVVFRDVTYTYGTSPPD